MVNRGRPTLESGMRRPRPWILVTALVTMGLMAGCYSHVVRAEGFGEDTVDTYEANVPAEQGPIEKAMWGDDPKKEKSWRDR